MPRVDFPAARDLRLVGYPDDHYEPVDTRSLFPPGCIEHEDERSLLAAEAWYEAGREWD